jgi:hypothetical protein
MWNVNLVSNSWWTVTFLSDVPASTNAFFTIDSTAFLVQLYYPMLGTTAETASTGSVGNVIITEPSNVSSNGTVAVPGDRLRIAGV